MGKACVIVNKVVTTVVNKVIRLVKIMIASGR